MNQKIGINFNAAYTDATFDSGTAPINGSSGTADSDYGKGYNDISGNWVNSTPRWTTNITLQHQHDVFANAKHYSLVNYG